MGDTSVWMVRFAPYLLSGGLGPAMEGMLTLPIESDRMCLHSHPDGALLADAPRAAVEPGEKMRMGDYGVQVVDRATHGDGNPAYAAAFARAGEVVREPPRGALPGNYWDEVEESWEDTLLSWFGLTEEAERERLRPSEDVDYETGFPPAYGGQNGHFGQNIYGYPADKEPTPRYSVPDWGPDDAIEPAAFTERGRIPPERPTFAHWAGKDATDDVAPEGAAGNSGGKSETPKTNAELEALRARLAALEARRRETEAEETAEAERRAAEEAKAKAAAAAQAKADKIAAYEAKAKAEAQAFEEGKAARAAADKAFLEKQRAGQ